MVRKNFLVGNRKGVWRKVRAWGHGDTDATRETRAQNCVKDFLGIIEKEGINEIVVVGSSGSFHCVLVSGLCTEAAEARLVDTAEYLAQVDGMQTDD